MDFAQLTQMLRTVAGEHDQNGVEFLAGAFAESGRNLDAVERYGVWPDVSFGIFQQTVRFAPIGDQSSSSENIKLVHDAFINDPHYAAEVAIEKFAFYRKAERNGLDAWCRYNSPNLHPFRNGNRSNYARGLRLAQAFWPDIGAYNSRVDSELQDYDWTCSVSAAVTFLRSLGIDRTEAYIRDWMVQRGLLSFQNGLEDARGYGLVRYFQDDAIMPTIALEDMSWQDAWNIAGTTPLMIGSGSWYHWVFVKHITEDEQRLILGNPASSLMGIVGETGRYGGDEMAQEFFEQMRPWNGVRVTP